MTARQRINLTYENEDELAPEHQSFRAAVTRARKTATATGVYSPDGILVAVIMPVEQVTREDAAARKAHAKRPA